MSQLKSKSLILAGVAVLAMVANACTCGGGVETQYPTARHSLAVDTEGGADYLLDFGKVTVGARKVLTVDVTNIGSTALNFQLESPQEPFELMGEGGLEIAVGASSTLTFSFAPLEAMALPIDQVVSFETNEKNSRARKLRLKGQGIPPSLDCKPAPLDFGKVARGTERTLTTTCTNLETVEFKLAKLSFRGNSGEYFSGVVVGAPADTVTTIAPGGMVAIEVSFKAHLADRNEGELILTDANSQILAAVPLVGWVVVTSLEIAPSPCLNFGYVEVGATVRLPMTLTNVGTEELLIQGFTPEMSDFAVDAETPIRLVRGQVADVEVAFTPTKSGRRSSSIEIKSGEGVVSGCVTGFGGGPKLLCSPAVLDFGKTAIGAGKDLLLTCVNGGTAPVGEPIDNLEIRSIGADNDLFSTTFLDEQGRSDAPKPEGYAIGEGFHVRVSFHPEAEEFVSGHAVIETNLVEAHLTPLAGDGVRLPPCEITVAPPEIRFGTVERGSSRTRDFSITNIMDYACVVSGLRILDGGPTFAVTEVVTHVLGAGETLLVPVTFTPPKAGDLGVDYAGTVEFQVSNPDPNERVRQIPLKGRAGKPCIIIEPDPLDFGVTAPGCESRTQKIEISNVCAMPVTLETVELARDSANFDQFAEIQMLPEEPFLLVPGDRVEVAVRFKPTTLGPKATQLRVELAPSTVSEAAEELYSDLIGDGNDRDMQTDRFVQQERPKVDVLWVVDNSGSMGSFQEITSKRVPEFISFAQANGVDFHLAVTTTGFIDFTDFGGCVGGAGGVERGRFFPIDGFGVGWPRIMTNATQHLEEVWAANVKVGTCSAEEQPFEAAYRALTPPLSISVKAPGVAVPPRGVYPDPIPPEGVKIGDPRWDDGNIGFLRDDAHLSIVILSDEEDSSMKYTGVTPLQYLERYRKIKAPKFRKSLKVHGIIQESYPGIRCGSEGDWGDNIRQVVDATKGVYLNICASPDDEEYWKDGFKKISEGVFVVPNRFILRGNPGPLTGVGPVREKDIEVRIDGELQPSRDSRGNVVWTYDPVDNAVDFAPLFVQDAGTNVTVTYKVACSPN